MLHDIRERILCLLTSGRGVSRTVNGTALRVASRVRATFTPDYDRSLANYLRPRTQVGAEVWNVGANVGVWTLQFAQWVGPSGRVVAFEPNPTTAAFLRENARLNGFESRVEVVETAVGGEVGRVAFHVQGTDGMSRAGQPNPLLTDTTAIEVPVTTIDAQVTLRGRVPAWVLMDVEGWEIAALSGATGLLAHAQAQVVVELHPSAWAWSGHARADLEHVLTNAWLRPVPLTGQQDPLAEYGHVYLERLAREG